MYERGWGAYVPVLPGSVAVGKTRTEVTGLIREAIGMHIDGLREAGAPIPEPGTVTNLIEV